MRILVSGASGLIGRAVVAALRQHGHQVVRLVRRPPAGDEEIFWDPGAGLLEASSLEGIQAAIHFSGCPIAGWWTRHKKELIRSSRVNSTALLASRLATLRQPPEVFLCASAMGIYGDRGDEAVNEDSPLGNGFLADVCRQWEAAAQPAADTGIRTVPMRLGLVLAAGGGALTPMLPLFRLGLGGPLGSGRQYWSWIALEDVAGAVLFLLTHPELSGPVNLCAPDAVTNLEFSRTLARLLRRPCWLPAPDLVLRPLAGGMFQETVLASTRARPARLLQAGFQFRYPDLQSALRYAMGSP